MHLNTPVSRRTLFVHAGALAAVLAACGSDSSSTSNSSADTSTSTPSTDAASTPATETSDTTGTTAASSPSPNGDFPVTIDHALGATTIDAAPQRVLAISDFGDLDNLLALDVRPVLYGYSDSWDTGVSPWQEAAGIADLEQYAMSADLSIEIIAAAEPDLIVGMQWPAADFYETLTDIAPMVALGWDQTWQDSVRTVGAAVGRNEQAAALIADGEAAIADAAAQLSAFGDLTFMVGSYYGDILYVQGETSPVVGLLRAVGLTVLAGGPEALAEYSLEQVEVLADADVLLSLATDIAATELAEASELWQQLPAVVAGRYTAIPGLESRSFGDSFNALSYSWALPRLVEVVTEAAQGRGVPLG